MAALELFLLSSPDSPAAATPQLPHHCPPHAAGSAGSYEDWRPDKARFKKTDYSAPLQGWEGESWLDVRSSNVRAIMADVSGCHEAGTHHVHSTADSTASSEEHMLLGWLEILPRVLCLSCCGASRVAAFST